jgi:hypothetical protein
MDLLGRDDHEFAAYERAAQDVDTKPGAKSKRRAKT